MAKFPIYYQHDTMQCGVTCLQMVCKYFKKEYSSEYLNQLCSTSKNGVSLLSLKNVAEQLGFSAKSGKLSLHELSGAPLPCILHWNQNHFVVLHKIEENNNKCRYYIADPSKGNLVLKTEEFVQSWMSVISTKFTEKEEGIALFLEPIPNFNKNKDSKIEISHSLSFLMNYLKQYKSYFFQIFIGLIIGSFIQLAFPFLTQKIVDTGIHDHNINIIYIILLAQLMLTFSRSIVDFIRRWILLHISIRINILLLSDFFIKLLKLPMTFFDSRLIGDLLQRMNDHNRVEKYLTNQALTVLFSILNLLVFGTVLLIYSKLIFTVFLLGSLIYAAWLATFLKKRKELDYLIFGKLAENNNKTYQFITGMQEIKLQGCENRKRWEWEDIQADVSEVNVKSLKLQQTQEAGGLLINEIKNIVITVLTASLVISGDMTLGMMLAVQYIIGQLISPVEQLLSFIYSSQDVKISLERINAIHKLADENNKPVNISNFKNNDRSIYIKNLSFKYDLHKTSYTLNNINLIIPEGKVTAIVGTSGSGKTTLIKLLLGYYPFLSGDIKIGNISITDYNKKWWRSQCGVVMQDGVIFSDSIARNIAVADEEIDFERLTFAAKVSNIENFILMLPLKYNTIIGPDGIGLSQGQKQRILIARAIYKNPQYIFMDEATNALDANNERAIVKNLKEFYKGKTVVIIAHRLSTVKDADQIIVIEGGKLNEIGTHTSLVESQGIYYHLVKNQLEIGA